MTDIPGKIIVVTGGASGIGRLISIKLAQLGGRVVIYDLDPEKINEVVEGIRTTGREAHGFVCDVSDRVMVYETAKKVRSEIGSADILINNAGVISGKPLMEMPDEEIETTMKVNVLALYWTTKSFLPDMLEKNSGHIVTMASAAGLLGVSRQTDYSASKHAAVGFTESLRVELKKSGHTGIKTTIIEPFYVDTGMFEGVRVKPGVGLPILKPDYVAKQTVKAIQQNKQEVPLPPRIGLTPVLRFLPTDLFDRVMDLLGVNDSMEKFVGRGKQ
ncbi:MAG: SDR family oxidoreductase [Rubrobacteraceae bacterium]